MKDGSDLKALRESLQWTQERMADYLGIDRSNVSRLERAGQLRGPVRKLAEKLAAQHAAPAADGAAA